MNRKTFLQTSAAAAISLVAFPTFYSCKQTKEKARAIFDALTVGKGKLATVRGNVSIFTNRGGTVGLLETSDGFVVIDAQFPDSIQPLVDSITAKEGKPVQFLCNTHHHGDHTAGNIAFKDQVETIISQTKVPEYQKIRAEENESLDKQLYANTLFDNEHQFELGGDTVKAYHYGAGHTYGDAIYHFEQDNVVHMGDLVFNKTFPFFSPKDGANAHNWVAILGKAIDKFDEDTKFIFGHASDSAFLTGSKEDLKNQKQLIENSIDFVEKQLNKEGKTPQEIIENYTFIPGFESWEGMWDEHWSHYITNLSESLQTK